MMVVILEAAAVVWFGASDWWRSAPPRTRRDAREPPVSAMTIEKKRPLLIHGLPSVRSWKAKWPKINRPLYLKSQ